MTKIETESGVEPSRTYYIDKDLGSYRSFYDHKWARDLSGRADRANLATEAFDLCEGWKGAANTAMLPWLVINTLWNFAEGYRNAPKPHMALLLDALAVQLGSQVQPSLATEQKLSMRRAIGSINSSLVEQLQSQPNPFNQIDAWKEMLQSTEFSLAIVGSRRIVYAAVYYTYEDFILSCFKRVAQRKTGRINRNFPRDLASLFGQTVADEVWNHDDVKMARLIRNSIAHNGARITPELKQHDYGIAVIDGAIQITPSLTRVTFNSLKQRASMFLDEAAKRLPVSA